MTTKRTARPKLCIDCKIAITSRNRSDSNDLCIKCQDYAMWENTHSDEGHDADNIDSQCWVCQKDFADEIDDEVDHDIAIVTGRRNMSHAACTHPRTSKGRAACRKANTK
jgi:hypothetical protein